MVPSQTVDSRNRGVPVLQMLGEVAIRAQGTEMGTVKKKPVSAGTDALGVRVADPLKCQYSKYVWEDTTDRVL